MQYKIHLMEDLVPKVQEAYQIVSLGRMIMGVFTRVWFTKGLLYMLCSSGAVDKLTTQA